MANIVNKIDGTEQPDTQNPQKEGSSVVGVTKQGEILSHGGVESTGINQINLRWSSRFITE